MKLSMKLAQKGEKYFYSMWVVDERNKVNAGRQQTESLKCFKVIKVQEMGLHKYKTPSLWIINR